jgi:uncharacterized protein (TIGR02001 family)
LARYLLYVEQRYKRYLNNFLEHFLMKKVTTSIILLALAGTAQADLSANIGFMSDYHFRGIFQAPTSASAGLDYENSGFYIGTWAADLKQGLEVDGYFGYAGEVGDFGYSIGYTGYFYTQDFDDTYHEINLGASYGILSFDVAVGRYDAAPGLDVCNPTAEINCPGEQDYLYYALTLEKNGFYGTAAGFGDDFDGEYLELGYGTTVADIDLGVSAIFASKALAALGEGIEDDEVSLVFSIGKSFDIN